MENNFANSENKKSVERAVFSSKESTQRLLVEIVGWILTIAVPVLLYFLTPPIQISGFDDEPKVFLCILSSASVMWSLSLLPDFMPGIYVLLATALLTLIDPSVVLSGFASSTFIIVLSIIVMTVAVVQSGVMKRFLLYLLKRIHSLHAASWVLFGLGFLITPFMPSIVSRSMLLGNLTNEIKNFSGKKENKNSDSLLYTSAYLGTTLFSSSFLTASLLNIIVLSILPLQEQQQFHTEGWFKATFVITAVLLIAYIFVLFIFFKNKEKKSCEFNLGLEKMGRITPNEIISLAIVLIFFFGILTTQHHHIASSWLGFSLLFLLMVLGVVSVDEFQKKVDWSYLFFLSAIIGISVTFKALKLDLWFYDNMLILFPEILEDKVLLFSLIALITILMRFMLPVGAVVAFLIPVILAIANKEGVSAWSLGMVVLFVGDIWFFPYQCFFYKYYRSIFNESYDIDEKKFLRINLVINAFKLIGLFLSFYYWKYLSLA